MDQWLFCCLLTLNILKSHTFDARLRLKPVVYKV